MNEYKLVDVKKESVFDYVENITALDGSILGYVVIENIKHYSWRYDKFIEVSAGTKSDGATSAIDIDSFGWIFHDELCAGGKWSDGSNCNNLQASNILSDILKSEGRWFRRHTWFASTWLFGGGKARDNGML